MSLLVRKDAKSIGQPQRRSRFIKHGQKEACV